MTSNVVKSLIDSLVVNNSSVYNLKDYQLPHNFYYKYNDFANFNEYKTNLVNINNNQQNKNGSAFTDIVCIPLYHNQTHQKIGDVIFNALIINIDGNSNDIVNEKAIFRFDNNFIVTENCDASVFYTSDVVRLRIVSCSGDFVNVFGYHIEVKIDNTTQNRLCRIVHN